MCFNSGHTPDMRMSGVSDPKNGMRMKIAACDESHNPAIGYLKGYPHLWRCTASSGYQTQIPQTRLYTSWPSPVPPCLSQL